jgi:branched-chain amino acid aminotransferase
MIQLQRPPWVYFDGKVRPYDEAVLHISTEAVYRGLNVFEGVKGYWSHDASRFGLLALPRHFARLTQSAALLHIPMPCTYAEFETAIHELIRVMVEPERDMWVRVTLYVVEGHWGVDTRADLTLIAYHQPTTRPAAIAVGTSTWKRADDAMLPARIKTSTNYQVARLARIEGRHSGFSEMVLLNGAGRVAEFTGAAVLMVRDGTVITPPAHEGALESITAEIVRELCGSLEIPFEVRPVDRTELYICDELAAAGTLSELSPVVRIDHRDMPAERPVLDAVQDAFFDAVRGARPHRAVDLSVVEATTSAAVEGSPAR